MNQRLAGQKEREIQTKMQVDKRNKVAAEERRMRDLQKAALGEVDWYPQNQDYQTIFVPYTIYIWCTLTLHLWYSIFFFLYNNISKINCSSYCRSLASIFVPIYDNFSWKLYWSCCVYPLKQLIAFMTSSIIYWIFCMTSVLFCLWISIDFYFTSFYREDLGYQTFRWQIFSFLSSPCLTF